MHCVLPHSLILCKCFFFYIGLRYYHFSMLILYSLWRFQFKKQESINSLELTPSSIVKWIVYILYVIIIVFLHYIHISRHVSAKMYTATSRTMPRWAIYNKKEKKKDEELSISMRFIISLCRVITQDCLTFIIYYDYTYCICIIIYNNVWNKI